MNIRGTPKQPGTFRTGAFQRRLALIFSLQLLAVAISVLMGIYNVAPLGAVLALIVIVSVLAWLAARREWQPIKALARAIDGWDELRPDPDSLQPDWLSWRTDADIASLARGMHRFASRIASFNQRERNFTRDASHELRSPLTVIKMSADMLADEAALSEFGERSVQRIKRATREMEALVEALLILARESDNGSAEEEFVVNDVLQQEFEEARQMLDGELVELQLEQPARFTLHASPRVFAVLCWQLIRNACQQIDRGCVVVTVLPGSIRVSNCSGTCAEAADRHGFELAIAQRISERFAWPLELQALDDGRHTVQVHFPQPLPA